MALAPPGSIPRLYDLAVNGVGLLCAWEIDRELLSPWKSAYEMSELDTLLERTDISNEEMTENKLDLLYWVSQRSWDYGAGQQRIDVNIPNYPSERAFLDSKGVDVFSTIGQATLLPQVANIVPLSNTINSGQPMRMAASDQYVLAAAGSPTLKLWSASDGSDVVNITSGTTTGQPAFDITSDGQAFYVALGPDGVTTLTTPATTAGMGHGGYEMRAAPGKFGPARFAETFVGESTTSYTGATTCSSYVSTDVRVIAWVKDSLYGAGLTSAGSNQWQFMNLGNAASNTIYILPAGYIVTDINELGGYIYFTADRLSRSIIYAWDGTNAPFVAVVMPPGETALKLIPFLGAGFLIGGRRIGSTSSTTGPGVLYRGFPQANGTLTIERIATFGTDNGFDYAPQAGTAYLDQAFFGRNNADGNSTGIGAYFPTTGGYQRHLEAPAQGIVVDAVVHRNKKLFAVDGVGVYSEQTTYVSSGTITSSFMDWNIDKQKMVLQAELGALSIPTGCTIAQTGTIDSTAFTGPTLTAGQTYAEGTVYISGGLAQTVTTLNSDPANLTTPVLKKSGLGAIYGVKPRRIYKVAIKAYQVMSLNNGTVWPGPQTSNFGTGITTAADIEAMFTNLRATQQIVQFQPAGYGDEHTTVMNVRVASMNVFRQRLPQVGWGNICQVTLYEVP